MRRSPLRHPLAVLRLALEMGQREMAGLLGCAVPTIQAVELKRLPLSGRLAQAAADQTGISASWLLQGDPGIPPVTAAGEPFTRARFAAHQARLARRRGRPDPWRQLDAILAGWVQWKAWVFEGLLGALRQGRSEVVLFRLHQTIQQVLDPVQPASAAARAAATAPLGAVMAEVRRTQQAVGRQMAAAPRRAAVALDLRKGLYARANRKAETYVARAARECARELRGSARARGGPGQPGAPAAPGGRAGESLKPARRADRRVARET